MPQGSLPALVVPIGPETVPLPGEHQSVGGVNVRIHIDVGIFARSAGVGQQSNDDFSDQLEDHLTALTAALAADPSLGGHLDWLVYSGCEPSILASDAPIPTAFWLLHFIGQYPQAELDALHANN